MILVDRVLEKREAGGRPIRVGLVGAGFMGRGTALQIFTAHRKGIRLVAISNRNLDGAKRAYAEARAIEIVLRGQGLVTLVSS